MVKGFDSSLFTCEYSLFIAILPKHYRGLKFYTVNSNISNQLATISLSINPNKFVFS